MLTTDWLVYSTEQRLWAAQPVNKYCLFVEQKLYYCIVLYCIHNNTAPIPPLSHTNPVHALPYYFFNPLNTELNPICQ